MAFDQEELNRRRAVRAQKRRQRQRVVAVQMVSAALVLVAAVVFMLLLIRQPGTSGETAAPTTQQTQPSEPAGTVPPTETEPSAPSETEAEPETEAQTQAEEAVRDDGPTTVIHVAAAGDLIVNNDTVNAGVNIGGYDYSKVFMDVAPVFSGADLAVLNFEGSLVGAPYGTKSQSAPQELVQAVKDMGVDLVQIANSGSITHGVAGLGTTLGNIRAAGLEPLGAFANPEEFQKTKGYTVVEVQGIRIAFVAFTKGMGGLSLPAGSEDCVNLLYTDYATTYQKIDREGITAILENVAMEEPDLTIALVHWGSEFKDLVTSNQKTIASVMQANGVDVILGTHSHMIHQVEYDPLTGQLVAYSLGDFFGEAERAGTDYSVILDLEITRDNVSGETRVTDFNYTPIYTLTEDTASDGQRRVVRLRQTIAAYEDNYMGKVPESVYNDMVYALKRISERVTPETETAEE